MKQETFTGIEYICRKKKAKREGVGLLFCRNLICF